jgi:Family of unknown function (DUF6869)
MAMNLKERRRLAASWLRLQKTPAPGATREDLSWVVERVWDLCDDAPNEAFEFILAVLEQDASSATLAILSAGPLESLLRKHGPRIIGRVERRARRDASFTRLLAHVWKDKMSQKIWARVQLARDRQTARHAAERRTAVQATGS